MLDQEIVLKSPCIKLEGGKDGSIHVSCTHVPDEEAARLSAETIAAQQAHNREEEGKRFKAEHDAAMWAVRWEETNAKLAVLIVAASAAYDYFSDKTDADLIDGTFRGNREAGLASELAEAIRRAKGERL